MKQLDMLDYRMPPGKPAEYASQALTILKELQKEFPKQHQKCFRCPSEVLTLSGVRAFDTYYELGEMSQTELRRLKSLLKKHHIWLLEESHPVVGFSNTKHSYSIVHEVALSKLPKQYLSLPEWEPFDFGGNDPGRDFELWWQLWKEKIMANSVFREDNPWRNIVKGRWGPAHDLTFGTLLGYPGVAIVDSMLNDNRRPFRRNMYANIAHAERAGPQPRYVYLKKLAKNPEIVAHQNFWSEVLTQVYAELDRPA